MVFFGSWVVEQDWLCSFVACTVIHTMADKAPRGGATLEVQPEYVSNGSSLGGEQYYDAADSLEHRHASVGCSSYYSSTTSSRFESGSAGTLLPTQKAAELMAVLASADSSNSSSGSSGGRAGTSAARSGSGAERNAAKHPLGFVVLDEGSPGGTLGPVDGFNVKKVGRKSTNPFDEENLHNTADDDDEAATPTTTTAGNARRQWHSHQPPPRMVVMDISSAETTPVHTAASTVSGAAVGVDEIRGSTSLWGGRSPSPSPLPPPRPQLRVGDFSISTNTNPFVTADEGSPISIPTDSPIDSPVNTNPFVTANSGNPLNPFPHQNDTETDAGKEGGSYSVEEVAGGAAAAAAEAGASAGGTAAVAAVAAGTVPETAVEDVVAVTACGGARGDKPRKRTPPPLPPRTPIPSGNAIREPAVSEAFHAWRNWTRGRDDSGRSTPNVSASTSGGSSAGSDKFVAVDQVSFCSLLLRFCYLFFLGEPGEWGVEVVDGGAGGFC